MDLSQLQTALPDWQLLRCVHTQGVYRVTGLYQGQARVFSLTPLEPGHWRYQERGQTYVLEIQGRSKRLQAAQEHGIQCAPMDGLLRKIDVQQGGVVKGQALYTLESMKMQVQICAPEDGVVLALCVAPGQQVCKGQEILKWKGIEHA